jgi:predicted Fe-Mo cluster-binding NifX family protein
VNERTVLLVTDDGVTVSGDVARAAFVIVARVCADRVTGWCQFGVDWREAYDDRPHSLQHAAVLQFLTEHGVEAVVAGDTGHAMRLALRMRGISVFEHGGIDARIAAVTAGSVLDLPSLPSGDPR